jgi:hypothetical protein
MPPIQGTAAWDIPDHNCSSSSSRGTRLKNWLANVGLLVGTVVVTDVFLAQVFGHFSDVCRGEIDEGWVNPGIASPIYHHDLAKNLEFEAGWGSIRYPFRTNSLGFRDASTRSVPARSESQRILFIGDSFTEGVGVAFENTFVGIIGDELRSKKINVFNAGVISYSPTIYYSKTKYLIEEAKFEFDRLVVFLDISDIQDDAEYYYLDAQNRVKSTDKVRLWWSPQAHRDRNSENDQPLRKLKRNLKENSIVVCLGDLIKDSVEEQLLPRNETAAQNAQVKLTLEEVLFSKYGLTDFPGVTGKVRSLWTVDEELFASYGAKGLRRASENMDRLVDVVRKNGIDITLVVYPWPDQIVNREINSRQVSFWKAWAKERNVRFIDLFPAFISEEAAEATIRKYFIPGDIHWSESGHRLVAESFLNNYEVALPLPR